MATILYVHRFLTSMVFTVLVETAVLFLLLRYVFKRKDISAARIFFVGALGSFTTIPYVWFVFPYVVDWPRSASIWVSEPFAFIVEALLYRFLLQVDTRTAFILSFTCNLSSYLLGPFLRSFGLWLYW